MDCSSNAIPECNLYAVSFVPIREYLPTFWWFIWGNSFPYDAWFQLLLLQPSGGYSKVGGTMAK